MNAHARTAVLHAADASNIGRELWNSEQNAERDRAGLGLRFNIPTVAKGHVYIGARREELPELDVSRPEPRQCSGEPDRCADCGWPLDQPRNLQPKPRRRGQGSGIS